MPRISRRRFAQLAALAPFAAQRALADLSAPRRRRAQAAPGLHQRLPQRVRSDPGLLAAGVAEARRRGAPGDVGGAGAGCGADFVPGRFGRHVHRHAVAPHQGRGAARDDDRHGVRRDGRRQPRVRLWLAELRGADSARRLSDPLRQRPLPARRGRPADPLLPAARDRRAQRRAARRSSASWGRGRRNTRSCRRRSRGSSSSIRSPRRPSRWRAAAGRRRRRRARPPGPARADADRRRERSLGAAAARRGPRFLRRGSGHRRLRRGALPPRHRGADRPSARPGRSWSRPTATEPASACSISTVRDGRVVGTPGELKKVWSDELPPHPAVAERLAYYRHEARARDRAGDRHARPRASSASTTPSRRSAPTSPTSCASARRAMSRSPTPAACAPTCREGGLNRGHVLDALPFLNTLVTLELSRQRPARARSSTASPSSPAPARSRDCRRALRPEAAGGRAPGRPRASAATGRGRADLPRRPPTASSPKAATATSRCRTGAEVSEDALLSDCVLEHLKRTRSDQSACGGPLGRGLTSALASRAPHALRFRRIGWPRRPLLLLPRRSRPATPDWFGDGSW